MIQNRFTTTAEVFRHVWDVDVDGFEYSEEASQGEIKGHLQQASPELIQNFADVITLSHIFWCGPLSDVKKGDILKIGGKRFGVKGIQDNSFVGTNKHLELQLDEQSEEMGS
jgi:hypothetical protein